MITRSSPSLARVAKVSNRKVSDHSNLKILNPKQMFQRLPKALAQLKEGNTSENLKTNQPNHILFVSSNRNY